MYCFRALLKLSAIAGLFAGCDATHLIGEDGPLTPCLADSDCALDQVCDLERRLCVRQGTTRNIDILVLLDNSTSMAVRQQLFVSSFKLVFQQLEAVGASYHVAVATSDVGSTVSPSASWGVAAGSCDTFAGDDGQLQALPCSSRIGLSAKAAAACQALCPDPSFVPAKVPFIAKDGDSSNIAADLVAGSQPGKLVDIGPQRAFQCMAFVGDAGCGIEGPLEGAKRALDGHREANRGFLRPDSVLAIIFVTDEDDCSVQEARRSENDPQTRDCPAPDADAPYDCFNLDYRCMARSVTCNEPLNTPGAKTNCVPRKDTYLESVRKYVDFFSALRPSNRLFIGGLWTLPALNQGGALTVVSTIPGMSESPLLNPAPQSCGSTSSGMPGAPQLRLSQLMQAFAPRSGLEVDLCNEDAYAVALSSMMATIVSKAGLTLK